MNIGEIIEFRRKELNLTLEEIGNYVGVGKSTVKKWEKGHIENMRRDKIELLSKILDLNPVTFITGELIYNEENIYQYENIIPLPETELVPLLGRIACGTPILAEENVAEFLKVEKNYHADFALECKGDSMINARIFDGDIVFIREQPTVENGEIAAVLIDNEATLKRVYIYKNRVELRAENPTFKTIEFEKEDMNKIKILGKAVAFTSIVI